MNHNKTHAMDNDLKNDDFVSIKSDNEMINTDNYQST